jgi:hypothetical protein
VVLVPTFASTEVAASFGYGVNPSSFSVVLCLMIGVQCALVILDPYPLGIQLKGIAGEFQGLSGILVSGGMVNRHVLVFRYPFHDTCHDRY